MFKKESARITALRNQVKNAKDKLRQLHDIVAERVYEKELMAELKEAQDNMKKLKKELGLDG